MTPKHKNMLENMITKITALYAVDPQLAVTVIDTAARSAHRLHGRATVPGDAERVEFVQSDGPTVEFSGKLLVSSAKEDSEVELWLTLSGGWVLLNTYRANCRAYTFEGDRCTPDMVFIATGYANWVKPIAKKMGWQWRKEID